MMLSAADALYIYQDTQVVYETNGYSCRGGERCLLWRNDISFACYTPKTLTRSNTEYIHPSHEGS